MRKKVSRTNQVSGRDTIPPEHNSSGVAGTAPPAKRILGAYKPRRDILLVLLGVVLGGGISWLGNFYYYQKAQHDADALHQRALRDAEANKEETIASYVVAAMLPQHPVKDSYELRQRVDQYLVALRRTKADHRGTPVYRENGSIGVDWSINVGVGLSIKTELEKPHD